MSHDAEVVLVVCTRNRAPVLGDFFGSLRRLSCPRPWEMVFVDNGSTDDTSRLLAEFCSASPVPCRTVREPRPGLSSARNAGWRASAAPTVCYTDDDCYPAPDLLERILEAFADPRIGYVAGRVLLHDPTDLPTGIKPDPRRLFYPAGHVFPPGELHGANLSFRRSVLEAIGGFDELIGAGTPYPFEDIDAVMRASLAGFAGCYDPRPTVFHHHRRRDRHALRRVEHAYARGRGAYFAKFLLRSGRRMELVKRWIACMRYHGIGWLPTEIRAASSYVVHVGRHPGGLHASRS